MTWPTDLPPDVYLHCLGALPDPEKYRHKLGTDWTYRFAFPLMGEQVVVSFRVVPTSDRGGLVWEYVPWISR